MPTPNSKILSLALGEWSSTSSSNLPGIWCVDEFLEIWVVEVLAKARLLFFDLVTALF